MKTMRSKLDHPICEAFRAQLANATALYNTSLQMAISWSMNIITLII